MATAPTTVPALLHELSSPLTVLISTGDLLRSKVPDTIEPFVRRLGDTSHRFGREVVELRASLEEKIDLRSSAKAAAQIRQLAADWRCYQVELSDLVLAIQAAQVRLEDSLLDRILNQNLPNGLSGLTRNIDRLEAIRPEDLALPEQG
ncbi:MAG: hypothetical protein P9E88_10310 [Candidatus Competibacter sp.]|jgi:hypothetical protein|nr:hypothetical protein [Gammaproteobacteria bacterium]MDG4561673.1 hypothetical protein [Candidatus Competibacter sp.]